MNLNRVGRVVAGVVVMWGVGLSYTGAAGAASTVAWGTTRSAPAGKMGQLFGVATTSSHDVLAVGGFNPGQPPTALLTKPYAEHWNGSEWTATKVPLGVVYGSGQTAQLNGVAEVAPGDGWAVGVVADPSSFASQTLAYHWDGTSWTRTATPDPAGPAQGNQLSAVAVQAASDVWAVGADGNELGTSLVLQWNGSTWAQVSIPDIGPLAAVTVAPGRVWVGGVNEVDQFDGTVWTELPAAPDGGLIPEITGLADTAAGLWAVGYADYGCGESTCTAPYAALWNGTNWTVKRSGGGTDLTGVVATGSEVLATSANPAQVLRLTTTSATAQVTPQGPQQYNAIATDPAGRLWAVGLSINGHDKTVPGIINAPGIGQGGIIVSTGASYATVTWVGPVNGTGSADVSGHFSVGGLPDGTYTVTASLAGCPPGVAIAHVTSGVATPVRAHIGCGP